MSFTDTRPYFRGILDGLDYIEWRDALNFDNIPHTIIDRSYHIESISIAAGAANQLVYTYTYNVNIRLFRKAYNDTVGTFEELEADVLSLSEQVLKASNRLSTTNGLLDVIPGSITFSPIDTSNDNLQVAIVGFTTTAKQCF